MRYRAEGRWRNGKPGHMFVEAPNAEAARAEAARQGLKAATVTPVVAPTSEPGPDPPRNGNRPNKPPSGK
jgi:hypothetical protein